MGGKLRPIGLIVGLLGAGLTYYALFSLFASVGCISAFAAGGCAGPAVSPMLVLPLGIILAVAGMLMGGGTNVSAKMRDQLTG